jgi:hypothetical protein
MEKNLERKSEAKSWGDLSESLKLREAFFCSQDLVIGWGSATIGCFGKSGGSRGRD